VFQVLKIIFKMPSFPVFASNMEARLCIIHTKFCESEAGVLDGVIEDGLSGEMYII
jgi:hypothetical protein